MRLPGRTASQAVTEGKAIAAYVSNHTKLPAALTLEFERVLCPCLLDAHNRYAGAEFVTGDEPKGQLHIKGLIERRQCAYVADVVKGALTRLLVEGDDIPATLAYCARACRELLAGEVPSDLLCEGGFLKRCDQRDLLRMAGMEGEKAKPVDKAEAKKLREADETLRKENAVALAIETLRQSATRENLPTVVFRQGGKQAMELELPRGRRTPRR